VIRVLVGQEYDGDLAGRLEDLAEMVLQHRSGVDDDRLVGVGGPQDPGVGAVQRHRSRVGGQDAGGVRRDLLDAHVVSK
jgi:hypothetical protein